MILLYHLSNTFLKALSWQWSQLTNTDLLPGNVANEKDGEMELWLLIAPKLVTAVALSRPLGKLGGLMICRLSREQLPETFLEALWVDRDVLASIWGVLSVSLSASVSPRSFVSSSEPSESLSRLLSDSAGDSSMIERNDILISILLTTKPYSTEGC